MAGDRPAPTAFASAGWRSERVRLLAMLLVALLAVACGERGDGNDRRDGNRTAMTPDPGATVTISVIDSDYRIVGSYTLPTALPDGSYAVDVLIDDQVPQSVGTVVVDRRKANGTPARHDDTVADVSE